MSVVNIVELIENNPVTRLTNTYQSKLITRIKEKFNDNEQQLFVASFYCFLHCNKTDFVIDLDNVWQWLGFQQKYHAKHLLEKHFKPEIDYKILLPQPREQKKHGGHLLQKIMLTINAFKRFCLKAGTAKADQIHEYYLKLEETLQEVINEESDELKLQLENKHKELETQKTTNEKEKYELREKTILEQFPVNTQCVYYGIIDNVNENNQQLVKFGCSNQLRDRVLIHKTTFANFRLLNAFKVDNKTTIENLIKKDPFLSKKRTNITTNNEKHIEILALDTELTLDVLDKKIKQIINDNEYTPENYKKLLKEINNLKNTNKIILEENENLKEKIQMYRNNNVKPDETTSSENKKLKEQNLLLFEENEKLKIDNIKLMKKYKINKKETYHDEPAITINTNEIQNIFIPKEKEVGFPTKIDDVKYDSIVKENLKRIAKDKDGFFHIGNYSYPKLFGDRQEVWDRKAYKTTGNLVKEDFILNKTGQIVSKKKFLLEKQYNRLGAVNDEKKQRASKKKGLS